MEFEWDDANVDHIAEHDLSPEEAEATFFGFRVTLKAQTIDGEKRLRFIGSVGDRILFVVYTIRGESVRVVTAFDAEEAFKALYRERKPR
ncbi:MAG: BrnT family toxin [Cyanobacteria bacterium REEB65]|nr:BrnT family toxin [Cyanobacteria bacterium REEB65]